MTEEMKETLEIVEDYLNRAVILLHDTGDYESQDLDDATSAVETALNKIKRV
jgi:hypothetical protein